MSEVAEAPALPAVPPDPLKDVRPINESDFDGYEFTGNACGARRFEDDAAVISAKIQACVRVARTGVLGHSCAMAGITPKYKGLWIKDDPEWKDALDEAMQFFKDIGLANTYRRVLTGRKVKKRAGRDQQGRIVYADETKYDDPILTGKVLAALDSRFADKPSVSITDNSQRNTLGISLPENFDVSSVVKNIMGAARYRAISTIEAKALPETSDE